MGSAGQEVIIQRVAASQPEVRALVLQLDQLQISLYGLEACNLEPLDLLEQHGVIFGAYVGATLVGIGALKVLVGYAEIKRFYFLAEHRGRGGAAQLIARLESYARARGVDAVCLETGHLQRAAIRFYEKAGYRSVERFGAYTPNPVSVYMKKTLSAATAAPDVH